MKCPMLRAMCVMLPLLGQSACSSLHHLYTVEATNSFLWVKATDPMFAYRLKGGLLQRLKAMTVPAGCRIRVRVDLDQGDVAFHPEYYASRRQNQARVVLEVESAERSYKRHFTEVTSFHMHPAYDMWSESCASESGYESLLWRVEDSIMLELITAFQ